MRPLTLAFLCAALLTGCGVQAPAPQAADPAEVYEAALRHGLPDGDGDGVYVQIDWADPPAETLARLRERWPSLRPASEAGDKKARRVHVEELKWLGRDEAEVRGGWGDGIDGAIYVYRLARRGGAWVVTSRKTEAVS